MTNLQPQRTPSVNAALHQAFDLADLGLAFARNAILRRGPNDNPEPNLPDFVDWLDAALVQGRTLLLPPDRGSPTYRYCPPQDDDLDPKILALLEKRRNALAHQRLQANRQRDATQPSSTDRPAPRSPKP